MATLRRALCAAPIEALEAVLWRYQAQLAGETGDAGLLVTKQGEMLRGAGLSCLTAFVIASIRRKSLCNSSGDLHTHQAVGLPARCR